MSDSDPQQRTVVLRSIPSCGPATVTRLPAVMPEFGSLGHRAAQSTWPRPARSAATHPSPPSTGASASAASSPSRQSSPSFADSSPSPIPWSARTAPGSRPRPPRKSRHEPPDSRHSRKSHLPSNADARRHGSRPTKRTGHCMPPDPSVCGLGRECHKMESYVPVCSRL